MLLCLQLGLLQIRGVGARGDAADFGRCELESSGALPICEPVADQTDRSA
jgi:hypothetical protein